MIPDTPRGTWVTTDVPGRLDALGWSRWHQRLIVALGITWILDGLEASLVANVAPTLQHPDTLGLSATQIGMANSAYLLGQVAGALVFGHLTDRLGR
jgi:MFS family permease